MFVKRLLIAASPIVSPIVSIVAAALISAPTSAGVIDLSTGAAPWQLTAIQPFYAPYDAPAQNNVYGTLGAPAPTIIPNAAWNHTLESSADWIGPTTHTAVKGISGFYTVSLPIDTLLTPGDTYNIQGLLHRRQRRRLPLRRRPVRPHHHRPHRARLQRRLHFQFRLHRRPHQHLLRHTLQRRHHRPPWPRRPNPHGLPNQPHRPDHVRLRHRRPRTRQPLPVPGRFDIALGAPKTNCVISCSPRACLH